MVEQRKLTGQEEQHAQKLYYLTTERGILSELNIGLPTLPQIVLVDSFLVPVFNR